MIFKYTVNGSVVIDKMNMVNLKKLFHIINLKFSDKILLDDNIIKKLSFNKITILDVGATGLNYKNKFSYSFDLAATKLIKVDDLMSEKKEANEELINTLLWSENKKKKFNITKNLISSSLYEINEEVLKNFKNFDEHQIIDIKEVFTKKIKDIQEIDKCNFMKLDAEGAELEIMKGMEDKIDNVLGVEIETQFVERYLGSPSFAEVNKFLEDKGFELYLLNVESWVREDGFFNSSSNHKVIWGDLVYFKKLDALKILIQNKVDDNIIEKLVSLLLLYKFFDEANYLINNFYEKKLINFEIKKSMVKLIKRNMPSNLIIIMKSFSQLIFSILILPITFFFIDYRKAGISYFKISFRKFLYNFGDIFKVTDKNKNVIRDLKL